MFTKQISKITSMIIFLRPIFAVIQRFQKIILKIFEAFTDLYLKSDDRNNIF